MHSYVHVYKHWVLLLNIQRQEDRDLAGEVWSFYRIPFQTIFQWIIGASGHRNETDWRVYFLPKDFFGKTSSFKAIHFKWNIGVTEFTWNSAPTLVENNEYPFIIDSVALGIKICFKWSDILYFITGFHLTDLITEFLYTMKAQVLGWSKVTWIRLSSAIRKFGLLKKWSSQIIGLWLR